MDSNTFLDSVRNNMSNYFDNLIYNIKAPQSNEASKEVKAEKDVKIVSFEPKESPKVPKVSNAFKRRKSR